jgi:hypothetical protein
MPGFELPAFDVSGTTGGKIAVPGRVCRLFRDGVSFIGGEPIDAASKPAGAVPLPQPFLIPGQGLNGRWDFSTRGASVVSAKRHAFRCDQVGGRQGGPSQDNIIRIAAMCCLMVAAECKRRSISGA